MNDENVMAVLQQALHECGNGNEVKVDSDLVDDLDVDSLGLLSIATALEKAFQVRIPDHRIEQLRSVQYIMQMIRENSPLLSSSVVC